MAAGSSASRDTWIGRAAFGAGVLALAVPKVALGCFLATFVATVALAGRPRGWSAAGLLLATAGSGWFLTTDGAAAIVMAGRRSGEERAVSRLRELQWAEQQALDLGLRKRGSGEPRFLTLPELLEGGPAAVVRSDVFRPAPDEPGVFVADGYRYVIDVTDGGRGFQAYAWPGQAGGSRLFFGDEADRVCEAPCGEPASLARRPQPFAAFAAPRPDAARCGQGLDGRSWAPWKGKTARERVESSGPGER